MKQKSDSFTQRVLNIVRDIPEGQTLSYKEVAVKAGSPHASRAVGSIMKANFDDSVPCHRVIHSNGRLGDYNRGGADQKALLLAQEKMNVASRA